MSTTTDLRDFGARELEMAADLLKAIKNGIPDGFDSSGITVMMNTMSGNVFLTNDDFQVAMLNDDEELESFYTSPYDGKEGFFKDLIDEYPDMHKEDREWMEQINEDYHGEVLPVETEDGVWIKEGESYWIIEDDEPVQYELDSDSDTDEDMYSTDVEAWHVINEDNDLGLNYEAFQSNEEYIQAVKDKLEE